MSTTPTQPGAEMDAQVARMMGWTHIRPLERGAWRGVPPGHTSIGNDIPAYSTDWSAAALVIEHVRKSNLMVSISYGEGGWWCVIYPPVGACIEGEYCETMPHSVCLAALSALSDAGDGSSGEGAKA